MIYKHSIPGGHSGSVPGFGLNADNSRRVDCPKCGARAPGYCTGEKGQRLKSQHPDRRVAARAAYDGPLNARSRPK